MIEPVSVPILLDLELEEEELDLSIEEAEEYAAQIGSLITISEVYGGLPSGGNAGEILIKNSDEDYDAIWGIIKNGANIWWTSHLITQGDTAIYTAKRYVIGRTDMQPEIHDFLVGRDIEVIEGTPNTLYEIIDINQLVYNLKRIGNIGENDYNKLLNKPQIDGIEINKDSTPASLGLATASALEEKYTKPSGGIPASDLAEGVIPEVHNVPSGGSVGQVLIKNSNEDYDANWSDIDSELPDVNSTDYGKVLAVSNDGIWNAQQPIFMVTITNNNNVFSANKTFSEITNAARHNMMVVATYANAYYQYCGIGGGTAVRQFVHIFTRDKVQTIKLFSVNISNVWTQYQYQLGTYSKPDSGIPANDLADDVHLIPAGGSEGYVLKKNSSNDYDVIWAEDNITETEYFDFTWDSGHNPVPATGVTGEAIFNAITNGKLVFARVTVNSSSYPYIFSLQAYYSNTLLQFVSVNGSIVDVLGYEYFFGQDTWYINEYIIPDPAQDTPANLGVAAVGSSSAFARADHVHAMPSAADLGVEPEAMVVHVMQSGYTYSADKTYNQIIEAYQANKRVVAILNNTVYQLYRAADYVALFTANYQTNAGIIAIDVGGAVTASIINLGTYSKPSGGIPKDDLASGVQTSLGKADTALQSFTETDPTVPSWAKASDKPSYTASEVGALSDTTLYAGSIISGGPATVANGIHYAQVDSTSTSTVYTASIPNIDSYYDGLVILLKNGVVTSASGFTIDINNLGAKPVYSNMAAATRETTIFNVNYTLMLIYDSTRVEGGCWINYRGYYTDANSIGYQIRGNNGTLPAKDKFVRYRLLFTSADGTHFVPANTSTSTNATSSREVNQSPIDPFGRIVYYSATTAISAGGNPGATYLWSQYQFALGYSFNRTGAALVLNFPAPVYIKCAPQADGSAIIDSTTPYVQALPNTADGKIYIFLGIAYSATNVDLYGEHPVYYHDGTGIRLWSGKIIPTIPSGGSTGQVLKKVSGTDYDTEWANESAPVTSVNGQTGAVTVPEPFVATYTIGQTTSCDKTYAEIEAAVAAGQSVIARATGGAIGQTANIYANQNGDLMVIMTLTAASAIHLTHTSTDTITWDILEVEATDVQFLDQFLENKGYYEKPSTGIPASDLENGVIPTIPTNVSSFTNDAGYLTLSDLPIYDGGVS